MSLNYRTLNLDGLVTREQIRRHVILEFMTEIPGTGKGNDCSKYIYYVETLENRNRVYLTRPSYLNKGMGFDVHVEGLQFQSSERGIRLSVQNYNEIINDLFSKITERPEEYARVVTIINKINICQEVPDEDYLRFNFTTGHPIEAILKVIKWMFIEQDVTNWNRSGRNEFIKILIKNGLC